jgi:hypothetical protein
MSTLMQPAWAVVWRASQVIFDGGDAAEAPAGVGEFLDQDGFGSAFGLELVDEVLDVVLVGGEILGGEEGGGGGESVGDGVLGGVRFAFHSAGAGGVLGIGAVDAGAVGGGGCRDAPWLGE